MVDLADSCFKGAKINQLLACSLGIWGKMNICSNRLMCESVCKNEGAYGECILQAAQNIKKVVWQLGCKRACKT